MAYTQKRKWSGSQDIKSPLEPHWLSSHQQTSAQGAPFIIEAYEVDVVAGQESVAQTLEVPTNAHIETPRKGERGSVLVRWDVPSHENNGEPIWVDRYDARLLLQEYPECCRNMSYSSYDIPPSPSGWSDLPSDTEDAFFLSASEVAELRHTKQRKELENAHNARLSALRASGDDENIVEDDDDVWGASDEEPDEVQRMLMERTATHLRGAGNRTLLMARILANHGSDKRFAFLRGRWKLAWIRAQAQAAAKAKADAEEKEKTKLGTGIVGLSSYADSDEEISSNEDESSSTPAIEETKPEASDNELKKKEMRRARAREWAAKRRLEMQEQG